jgi:hypothetical protein
VVEVADTTPQEGNYDVSPGDSGRRSRGNVECPNCAAVTQRSEGLENGLAKDEVTVAEDR